MIRARIIVFSKAFMEWTHDVDDALVVEPLSD